MGIGKTYLGDGSQLGLSENDVSSNGNEMAIKRGK
jgi:hypothetical protein